MALVIKSPPANAGNVTNAGSIPGLRRSPEEGHDNPVQYSCLENPMDRGVWRATVYGVAKSKTRLRDLVCILKKLFFFCAELEVDWKMDFGTHTITGVHSS